MSFLFAWGHRSWGVSQNLTRQASILRYGWIQSNPHGQRSLLLATVHRVTMGQMRLKRFSIVQPPSVFRKAYYVSRAGPRGWGSPCSPLRLWKSGGLNFNCAFSQNDILVSFDKSHHPNQSEICWTNTKWFVCKNCKVQNCWIRPL